ncbi:hypothetical protein KUCAC02_029089 [Chaenocephalus aceratus]|uniref:Uncharacterized protein n=1 Tax=Chaenocephalus aceratus TaxID=36190 RepID=A0ACB9X5N1_CHAAC|nr:hypothetical protein KUCAC02_029089 [Chaenocephalus aceratus]
MSFMEETKTEPETVVKEEIPSNRENPYKQKNLPKKQSSNWLRPWTIPPDCSRFDSSGNLSPASSQLSSEPEERRDPENPPSTLRPPHESQKSSWNEEEHEEEFEKELHPLPEPGSNKDLHESLMILPKPILDNQDKAKMCFFEDGPPPCSPSKVRWLKAYNRVRVQLLEYA